MEPQIILKRITYGALFCLLAEQEKALTAGELHLLQGDGFLLIACPTFHPHAPLEPEPLT